MAIFLAQNPTACDLLHQMSGKASLVAIRLKLHWKFALRQKFNRVDKRLTAGSVIVHSDAIKHLETGRYFLSTYLLRTKSKPSRLVFYSSCDGEKWTLAGGGNPRGDGKSGWSYLTLLDRDNTDFGVAKKEFDVIADFDYGKPKRSVYRMKVDVGDNCSCNN